MRENIENIYNSSNEDIERGRIVNEELKQQIRKINNRKSLKNNEISDDETIPKVKPKLTSIRQLVREKATFNRLDSFFFSKKSFVADEIKRKRNLINRRWIPRRKVLVEENQPIIIVKEIEVDDKGNGEISMRNKTTMVDGILYDNEEEDKESTEDVNEKILLSNNTTTQGYVEVSNNGKINKELSLNNKEEENNTFKAKDGIEMNNELSNTEDNKELVSNSNTEAQQELGSNVREESKTSIGKVMEGIRLFLGKEGLLKFTSIVKKYRNAKTKEEIKEYIEDVIKIFRHKIGNIAEWQQMAKWGRAFISKKLKDTYMGIINSTPLTLP